MTDWDTIPELDNPDEDWRMPPAWKVLMTALMVTIAKLDKLSPEERTTENFLRQVEAGVNVIPTHLEVLTLGNETQARMLARILRENVQKVRGRE